MSQQVSTMGSRGVQSYCKPCEHLRCSNVNNVKYDFFLLYCELPSLNTQTIEANIEGPHVGFTRDDK